MALEIARQAAQSGDNDKAVMYLSAARPLVTSEDRMELSWLYRQAEPMESRRARHFGTVNRQLAERIEASRSLHESRMKQALGQFDPEAQADSGRDTPGISVLANALEIIAADMLIGVVKAESCDIRPESAQAASHARDEVGADR